MVPVLDTLKVKDPGIIEVLTREDDRVQIAGMGISDWVTVGVVPSKAYIIQ